MKLGANAMRRGTRNIPNILSLSRIVLSFGMFFVAQKPRVLFWVIVVCGITDALDGFLARRLHCESDLGARLDSLGDLLFFSALVLYVVRYQMDAIQKYLLGIYAIFLIKTISWLFAPLKITPPTHCIPMEINSPASWWWYPSA